MSHTPQVTWAAITAAATPAVPATAAAAPPPESKAASDPKQIAAARYRVSAAGKATLASLRALKELQKASGKLELEHVAAGSVPYPLSVLRFKSLDGVIEAMARTWRYLQSASVLLFRPPAAAETWRFYKADKASRWKALPVLRLLEQQPTKRILARMNWFSDFFMEDLRAQARLRFSGTQAAKLQAAVASGGGSCLSGAPPADEAWVSLEEYWASAQPSIGRSFQRWQKDKALTVEALQRELHYKVPTFKPTRSLFIREMFTYVGATSVLDLSAGYGEHLAAAAATTSIKYYYAVDPCPAIHARLRDMLHTIAALEGTPNGLPTFQLHHVICGAEDMQDRVPAASVSCVYFNPPALDAASYFEEPSQALRRFGSSPDMWLQKFFLPAFRAAARALTPGGVLLLDFNDMETRRAGFMYKLIQTWEQEGLLACEGVLVLLRALKAAAPSNPKPTKRDAAAASKKTAVERRPVMLWRKAAPDVELTEDPFV